MTTTTEPWVSYVVAAEVLRTSGVFLGSECLALPHTGPASSESFIPLCSSLRVVVLRSGARFVREDVPLQGPLPSDTPILLVADDMDPSEISELIERTGRAPDAMIHHGDCPLTGFRQVLPGLFASERVNGFVQDLVARAWRYQVGEIDAFDVLEQGCDSTPLLRRLVFNADGDASLEISPVPLVRRLDGTAARNLALGGAVRLSRWRPAVLRLPVFGLEAPEACLRVSGNAGSVSIRCDRSERNRIAVVAQTKSGACATIRMQQTGTPRATIDLQISGHDATLEAVSIRLPSPRARQQEPEIDPLVRFDDPLEQFG